MARRVRDLHARVAAGIDAMTLDRPTTLAGRSANRFSVACALLFVATSAVAWAWRSGASPGFAACAAAGAQSDSVSLVINIPAFRLDLWRDGHVVARDTVAVGMPSYPTPRGRFLITSVEWNPWWIPPDSPWARDEKSAPPGPHNPMGRAKLRFFPLYLVHGTPEQASLGHASSHGCVRLSNAAVVDLAIAVTAAGVPGIDSAYLATLRSDTVTTRVVVLNDPVWLDVRYDLAEVLQDSACVYPDIYRLGGPDRLADLQSALDRAGIDPRLLDTARAAALRVVRPTRRCTPLDSLIAPRASQRSARHVPRRGESMVSADSLQRLRRKSDSPSARRSASYNQDTERPSGSWCGRADARV
jgi:L,D-transpeptidase catalytic domain